MLLPYLILAEAALSMSAGGENEGVRVASSIWIEPFFTSEWKFTGKPARFHSEVENGSIQLYGDKNRRFFSVELGGITKSSTFMNINIDHVLLEYIYEIE